MFGTFEQPLPSYKEAQIGGTMGYSGLPEELGARAFTGGVHNSPFAQSGMMKAPFLAPGRFHPYMFQKPRRRTLNRVSIAMSWFLPTLIFAITTWLFCFSVRDSNPIWGWGFFGCCLFLAMVFFVKAVLVRRKQRDELWTVPWYLRADDDTWFLFLGMMTALAALLGVVYGTFVYSSYTSPYYNLSQLHYYNDTDPAMSGQAYLDAGSIEFKMGSYVDVGRSLGYKDGNTYCVAPIKFGKDILPNLDFWAAGVNCCGGGLQGGGGDGFPGSFNCFIDRQDAFVRGGLRITDNSQLAFYKVALMQADEEFQRTSKHPIFITWMPDPAGRIQQYWHSGVTWFWCGVVAYALLMLGAVVFFAMQYWKSRAW
jgi:hypothetical protein